MSDLRRLLPDRFAQTYWDAFGQIPPRDFLEAYELLCDVLYNGGQPADPREGGGGGGKRYHASYHFREPRVFGLKKAIDDRLAAIRKELRTWTETRPREAARRPRPDPDRRDHLAPARRARRRRTPRHARKEAS